MPKRSDTLVKGGLLVSGKSVQLMDVLISDGKVIDVTNDSSGYEVARTIDATGKYVLPGGIDAHCHPVYMDKMDQFTICAAYGGVTTVMPFVGNIEAWGFSGHVNDVVKKFIDDSEKLSYLDFAVHATYIAGDEDILQDSVPELIKLGVNSFKMFMAYKRRGRMISDEGMLTVMDLAAKDGGLAMVHAENGCCIEYLVDRLTSEGKLSAEWLLPSQPNILEVEGVQRAITYSQITDCPLYTVHLTTHDVLPLVRTSREKGLELYTETCPHYLTLTNREVIEKGPIGKVGPPLREKEDCDALWSAVCEGTIDVIGSDSGGFTRAMKTASSPMLSEGAGPDNIFDAPYGLNTIEFMAPVVWNEGINHGRITLPKFVEVFCENPAKIFGIYPKKGTLSVGADADLVVWDPSISLKVDQQHGNTDYSSFHGFQLLGMPILTMQRGAIIMENGEIKGHSGSGRFIPANVNATPYSKTGYKLG